MKLAPLGALTTGIVIAVGIVLVLPAYIQRQEPVHVMLSFAITDDSNMPEWCSDLGSVLERQQVKAVLFVSGKVAEAHPECAAGFSRLGLVDLGSQTYSYVNLTSIDDYTMALEEVQGGKRAVDLAAGLNSKLFRAPYALTDDDIYSLLSRSEIVADFSYDDHYNNYESGQFIRYPLTRVENPQASQELFDSIFAAEEPVMLEFDNSVPAGDIDRLISGLKSATASHGEVSIVNPSDLLEGTPS